MLPEEFDVRRLTARRTVHDIHHGNTLIDRTVHNFCRRVGTDAAHASPEVALRAYDEVLAIHPHFEQVISARTRVAKAVSGLPL